MNLTLFPSQVNAEWTAQKIASEFEWYDIASSSDGTKLAAVADNGYIHTSSDSGTTWTEQTAAGSRKWYGVTSSSDGTKLAAVAYYDYIYTSADSGVTWTAQTTAGSRRWLSVTSSADGTKLAAGSYSGYLYTSADSGTTWTEQIAAGSRKWYGVTSSSDGTKLAAGTYNDYIYTSADSGTTWTQQTAAGSRAWRSAITASSDGTKLAAGAYNDYIYTSADSGATWTEQTASGLHNWRGITSSSDGTRLAAVVNPGYIYTSADSGVTWTQQITAGSQAWRSTTSSSDGTKLAAVIYNGPLYTSADSGVTWTQQTAAGVSRNWNSITSSSDGTKLAAVAENTPIYTSADSGATWTEQTASGSRYWRGITSSSDGTKLAATAYNEYIHTSADSGVTWTAQTTSGLHNWFSITSSSDGTKLAAGTYNDYIYTSADSGATWTAQTAAGSRKWYGVTSSSDGTRLAAVVNPGYIYTSIDSGATWIERTTSGARIWYDITSSSNGVKLAAVANPGYIYTEDYNVIPTATAVSISGVANNAQLLTGNYTYADFDNDVEGTSTFRWLRNGVAIAGATDQTYTTVTATAGTTVTFEVIPVATTGRPLGSTVTSSGLVILNAPPSDIMTSSVSAPSNSPIGTTVGILTAVDVDINDTLTFALSTGAGCTATDNDSFVIEETSLKTAVVTDFYTKSSYTICLQVTDQDGASYRENFEILVPVPATVEVAYSSTGESELPDVPRIILDEEKTVDLSAATATIAVDSINVSIGGTNFNLESYTAGSLSRENVKSTAGIEIGQATRIATDQNNLVLTHTETADVSLEIPAQTVVFGGIDADFELSPPTDISLLGVDLSGFQAEKAVSVGSDIESYVFDTPVLIVFNENYDRMLMKRSGSTVWESVPQCEGTFASPTMPSFPDACWDTDKDLRISHVHTFHLTEFGGLIGNNFGSGKQALFYEGMKREDIRQSGYGTTKETFPDNYKLSLAEAHEQNEGVEGVSQFIMTTWNNNKFLRYIAGRTSLERQREEQVQRARYRIANNSQRSSDVELVMNYKKNNKTPLTSAPKPEENTESTFLQQEIKKMAKFFRPRSVSPYKTEDTAQKRTRASNSEVRVDVASRVRMLREKQKENAEPPMNYSSAPKIEKPISPIQQGQKERDQQVLSTVKGPAKKEVLRHLQNNLFFFADFLKTSLFDMADMLSTNLFKGWH